MLNFYNNNNNIIILNLKVFSKYIREGNDLIKNRLVGRSVSIFMVGTYQLIMMVLTAIQIMMPVIILAEKLPKARMIALLSSEETAPIVPELNKLIHVLIVIVFNGVGHCLLRPNEETPTVILEVSSDNNHESSILMRVLATMVPSELE